MHTRCRTSNGDDHDSDDTFQKSFRTQTWNTHKYNFCGLLVSVLDTVCLCSTAKYVTITIIIRNSLHISAKPSSAHLVGLSGVAWIWKRCIFARAPCVCERVFSSNFFLFARSLCFRYNDCFFFSLSWFSFFCYEIFFLTVWFRRNWLRLHLLFTKHLPRHTAFSAIDFHVFFYFSLVFHLDYFELDEKRKMVCGPQTAS